MRFRWQKMEEKGEKHFFRNIDGWFAREQQLLYKNQVKQANDGYHFVEIGSWKGRSSSYMGVEIINSGKKIARLGKKKYFKYFNSSTVSDYMISKILNIKPENKILWDNN